MFIDVDGMVCYVFSADFRQTGFTLKKVEKPMNLLDIIFAVLLVLGLVRGVMVGLVRQMASVAGLLAGGYAAYFYYPEISSLLAGWILKATYRDLVAFLLIFISVYFIVIMVSRLLQFLITISMAGWLDRLLGMVLGFLKAAIVCAVVLIAVDLFFPSQVVFVKNSLLAPHFQIIADFLKQTIAT